MRLKNEFGQSVHERRTTQERGKTRVAPCRPLLFIASTFQGSERFSSQNLNNANFSQAVSGGHVVRLRKSWVVEDSLPEVVHGASLGHDNLSKGQAVSKREQVRRRNWRPSLCTMNYIHTAWTIFFSGKQHSRGFLSDLAARGHAPATRAVVRFVLRGAHF